MAIGNRQIGWSQEDNLLWEISRQLDRMNSILCTGPCPTTTTTTTPTPTTTTSTTLPPTTTTTTSTTICLNCVEAPVTIGTQTWTKCNLNVATYSDLTPIPEVQDQATWDTLTTGAWCYYNNDTANGAVYGKLYNWYAVAGIYDAASLANPALRKKLAPIGYHVPSKTEFETLFNFTDPASGGGSITPNTAASPLKEIGNCHWNLPNTDATNSTGFTAFGGGVRFSTGVGFFGINDLGIFSTTTEIDLTDIEIPYMGNVEGTVAFVQSGSDTKRIGISVRLIADPLVNTDNLFQECNQPCGTACVGFAIYYNVWMTQKCIDSWPSIGCEIWYNQDRTNPFPNGTYNIGNGDCIVITGGIITDILT